MMKNNISEGEIRHCGTAIEADGRRPSSGWDLAGPLRGLVGIHQTPSDAGDGEKATASALCSE